jgi:preprotein translocase subunit YajC
VSSLIIILAMFVLLWVLMIRPQRSRQKQQQQLLASIERGDEVLTHGGLFGIVSDFDEDENLIVEIAQGVQVRMDRRAVATVVKPEEDEEAEAEEVEVEDEPHGVDAAGDHEDAAAEGSESVKNEQESVRA